MGKNWEILLIEIELGAFGPFNIHFITACLNLYSSLLLYSSGWKTEKEIGNGNNKT